MMSFFQSVQFSIFSIHVLRFLSYLPALFLFFSLFFCLAESCFCMGEHCETVLLHEQHCKPIFNAEGIVQLNPKTGEPLQECFSKTSVAFHPKTGEPLQDCSVKKSDYVVAMETIEQLAKQASAPIEKITGDTTSNDVECKTFK